MGAHWLVSEMVTSDKRLWHTRKSANRLRFQAESEPRWVQIAGGDADMLASAAEANQALGAQIIDINMGCPAKKVCNKQAGSALLRDEKLVFEIFQAVVAAVDIPVTVKIRLGWSLDEINAPYIAQMAEAAGIRLVTVHGRSRACKFAGDVDYGAIADVVQAVGIPVIANGDITSPEAASDVLQQTGAEAVMIGRAAQGQPWIADKIDHYLETGQVKKDPPTSEIIQLLTAHVTELSVFYGELMGPRIARKHVGWYLKYLSERPGDRRAAAECRVKEFLRHFNQLDDYRQQVDAIERFLVAFDGDDYMAA